MEIKTTFQGRELKGTAEMVASRLWIHFQGRTHVIETGGSARKRKGAAAGGSSDEVRAPMPGKITKILAAVGASVKTGDSLVVMEAMKMEYTLKAEANGTVKAIDCAVGAQVTLGQKLVQLEAEKG